MTLREEQVFPAVIIEVEKSSAPARIGRSRTPDAGSSSDVREHTFSIVVEDDIPLIGEIRDDQVRLTVVVVIRKISAHPSEGLAVLIESNARLGSYVSEGSVAIVVIQKAGNGIIRDVNVRPPVAVKICECNAKRLAIGICN